MTDIGDNKACCWYLMIMMRRLCYPRSLAEQSRNVRRFVECINVCSSQINKFEVIEGLRLNIMQSRPRSGYLLEKYVLRDEAASLEDLLQPEAERNYFVQTQLLSRKSDNAFRVCIDPASEETDL
jgi:hypothetical protein